MFTSLLKLGHESFAHVAEDVGEGGEYTDTNDEE